MSSAIRLIVRSYVRIGQRDALLEMKAHWTRRVQTIQDRHDFDYAFLLDLLKQDLEIIDDGLADFDKSQQMGNSSCGVA